MTSPFTALQRARASDINGEVLKLVRRGTRTANKNTITAEVGVLRVDSIPVRAGRAYAVMLTNFGVDGAAATDVGLIRVRYDETGAAATTASTQLSAVRMTVDSATEYPIVPFLATYYPGASDRTLSLLMTAQATAGTINILPDSNGLDLLILHLGLDPGDTGVDI